MFNTSSALFVEPSFPQALALPRRLGAAIPIEALVFSGDRIKSPPRRPEDAWRTNKTLELAPVDLSLIHELSTISH